MFLLISLYQLYLVSPVFSSYFMICISLDCNHETDQLPFLHVHVYTAYSTDKRPVYATINAHYDNSNFLPYFMKMT